MVFDEFNRLRAEILSVVTQMIITIQQAIKLKNQTVVLEDSRVNLRLNSGIFITINPGYSGRTSLPYDLRRQFRAVSMVKPDTIFITEILLYSSGFINAQKLSQKIVSVQEQGNKIMKNSNNSYDFGLRSIKAIIAIAERLKLQATNLEESEIRDVIDDETLNRVPYKPD